MRFYKFYTNFACLYSFNVTFWVFLVPFLAQNFQKLSFDCTRKSIFRSSMDSQLFGQASAESCD